MEVDTPGAAGRPAYYDTLRLPTKILYKIIKGREYPEVLALRWTCKDFWHRIPRPDDQHFPATAAVTRKHLADPSRNRGRGTVDSGGPNRAQIDAVIDLFQIECWEPFDHAHHVRRARGESCTPIAGLDFFACTHCFKLRSARHFSNRMMQGPRGKHSPHEWKTMYMKDGIITGFDGRCGRTCIDCRLELRDYYPGVEFHFGGDPQSASSAEAGYGAICKGCRVFQRVLRQDEVKGLAYCDECALRTKHEGVFPGSGERRREEAQERPYTARLRVLFPHRPNDQ